MELAFVVVGNGVLCHFENVDITLTKPLEEFVNQQLARGYADVREVARQALIRWMEEEELGVGPPRLQEKLEEARQGKFVPYNPQTYDSLLASVDETSS